VTEAWRWIPAHLAISWHARLIELFGGAPGIRDVGLLEGALARPANLVAYGENVSTEKLAALYGVGVARTHAFVDGNKRVAFAVMVAFLKAHGRHLDATEADATQMFVDIAAGMVDEGQLETWIIAHVQVAANDDKSDTR
jgi:death-on-curing protein